MCFCITKNTAKAAELMLSSWKNAVAKLIKSKTCPSKTFIGLVSAEIYELSKGKIEGDEAFASLPAPQISPSFSPFFEKILTLDYNDRVANILNTFGDISAREYAVLSGKPLDVASDYLDALSDKAMPGAEKFENSLERMSMKAQLKSSDKKVLRQITLPPFLMTSLERASLKATGNESKTKLPQAKRKVNEKMKKTASKNNSKKKMIISIVAVALAIALIATVTTIIKRANRVAPAVTVSYKIGEVTKGNVSTTVSGSGVLTPITKETFTVSQLLEAITEDEGTSSQAEEGTGNLPGAPAVAIEGTIESVNAQVGDKIGKGDVIATVVFEALNSSEDAVEMNIVAPYDAVILELYLKEGNTVTDSTSAAMLMGTDGYTMTISVDENNISDIKLGQEVDIKIDVSNEEMPVGEVSDISYNGSTSGSTTAYKITVAFAYVDGTYPGMSVSAEIVVEDSGEGLLVPVSAVQTSGDTKYIYIAPEGTVLAEEYDEEEIDLSSLRKVTVTTGMSDGSYIMVETGNIYEGDLVMIITRTSNQTGSSSSGNNMSGGRPDFSGGMPDFGGGMPDFSGGMPNFGGGMPW